MSAEVSINGGGVHVVVQGSTETACAEICERLWATVHDKAPAVEPDKPSGAVGFVSDRQPDARFVQHGDTYQAPVKA